MSSKRPLRGYVRLGVEEHGAELGNDHPLDGRSPEALGTGTAIKPAPFSQLSHRELKRALGRPGNADIP
jgi:hypothetical protein